MPTPEYPVAAADMSGFYDRGLNNVRGSSRWRYSQEDRCVWLQEDMEPTKQREVLLDGGDLLKLSLAGLLRDYELETWRGEAKKGKQMFYGPQVAGYCSQPWENVNYASCHDGETLFDQVHRPWQSVFCESRKQECTHLWPAPYKLWQAVRAPVVHNAQ